MTVGAENTVVLTSALSGLQEGSATWAQRQGWRTPREGPPLFSRNGSALYWSSLEMPPYRCLWETTCLVYYDKSFHVSLSLVLRREFKQTKWQTLYFEAGEVAQWLKVLVAELSDLSWRPSHTLEERPDS